MSPIPNDPFNDDERALNRALHGQVDPLQASPLGLGEVQAKARVVRRHRRIAAAAAVAAAVAVVVPTALVATRGLDSTPDRPPVATQAPDPTRTEASDPTTSSPPEEAQTQPFDLSALETGDDPKIDWADGRDVHRFDGTVVPGALPAGTTDFAPMADGWVVMTRDDQGGQYAQYVPADGVSTQVVHDASGGLATSPLGEVVAWATPEGTVNGFHNGGELFELPSVGAGEYFDAVAVTTEDCQEGRTSPGGCTVYVNTKGLESTARLTSSHGITDLVADDIDELTAWTSGRLAGIVERRDDMTTCSVVKKSDDGQPVVWETCDNRLMDFSPTGATVLGVGSVGDGDGGEGVVTLLDSTTGTPLVDLRADEKHQTFAYQWAWEDDSHVLLVVRSGVDWSIVRLGTDGSMEYAVAPVAGDADPSTSPPPLLLQQIS